MILGPHQTADLDEFFQLRKTHGGLREVVAIGRVLVSAPPSSDTEHEPATGQGLQRCRHLRREGRWSIAVAENVVTQGDIGKLGAQPGEGCPGFEERVGTSVEPVEVVSDPQAVEVRKGSRENVLLLVQDDRLVVAAGVADHR